MKINRFWGALGICGGLFVQSFTTYGAEGLLDILVKAKQEDPGFLGAGFQRDADREAVNQARSRLLPNLSYSIEETENKDEFIKSETQVLDASEIDYDGSTWSLNLSQSIYNHESWVRYGQSKVIRDRADVDYDRARQDLLLNVAERYFTVLKTEEQLGAINAEKQALKQHMEYAAKSRRAGLGRRSEVTDAEARYFTALAEEAAFSKALEDARFSLMELTGELHQDLRPIQERLPLALPEPAEPQAWIDRGLAKSPDVLAQQFRLEESRLEIKAQNAGHFPTLNLVYRNYTEEQSDSQFGGASETDRQELALQLEIPIYQGGAVSSRKREAMMRMHKSQEDLTQARRSVRSEVNSAYQGIVANIAQVKALQKTVTSQQEVLRNKQKGHQAGLYTMLIVLDAQRDLADAERNYIEARYDYAINSLRLKRAAGVLIEDDLKNMNNWLQ